MSELSFPDDWDDRSTTYLGQFRHLDDEERLRLLGEIFVEEDYRTFSGIALALSMLYSGDVKKMTPLLAGDARHYDVMPKLAAIEALRISENGFNNDNRGPLNTLHKQICFLLFESVLEMKSLRKLVLKNKASTFTVLADRRSVSVSFEINGHRDGGAQTLSSVAGNWLRVQDSENTRLGFRMANFVSSKHCSAYGVFSHVEPQNRAQIWHGLTQLYRMFRSVGPLNVSLDLEPESAWNLVIAGLRPLSEVSRFSLKVRSLAD
jgi:hypothetical protein